MRWLLPVISGLLLGACSPKYSDKTSSNAFPNSPNTIEAPVHPDPDQFLWPEGETVEPLVAPQPVIPPQPIQGVPYQPPDDTAYTPVPGGTLNVMNVQNAFHLTGRPLTLLTQLYQPGQLLVASVKQAQEAIQAEGFCFITSELANALVQQSTAMNSAKRETYDKKKPVGNAALVLQTKDGITYLYTNFHQTPDGSITTLGARGN